MAIAHHPISISLCLMLAIANGVIAQAPSTSKDGFTLGNPTPRELMRPLAADRPDATESPVTVDAGHVQIELSFIDYSREREDGGREDVRTFFDTNIKVGLTNHVDVQFVLAAHTIERMRSNGGPTETRDGFADVTLRLKVNLWGNDDGDGRTPPGLEGTALAIMPFITIPTGSEISGDHVEAGLIVPFSFPLADRIGVGLMAELDLIHDDDDGNYDLAFVHTAVLGFELTESVGAFVEYVGIVSSDAGQPYVAFISTGLTLALSDDVMLDAGIRAGLNDAAEDFGIFTGLTLRF